MLPFMKIIFLWQETWKEQKVKCVVSEVITISLCAIKSGNKDMHLQQTNIDIQIPSEREDYYSITNLNQSSNGNVFPITSTALHNNINTKN